MRSLVGRIGTWSRSRGGLSSVLFYRLLSPVYSREMRAVASGLAVYRAGTRAASVSTQTTYQLRRNIHMIEKGLTMEPRRPMFAAQYIDETVDLFSEAVAAAGSAATDELEWCAAVLRAYFEATAERDEVASLRARFVALGYSDVHPRKGPSALGRTSEPVQIAAIEALASRRRSVRWFDDRLVPRDLVSRALRVGAEAPTACNRQPYRFVVIDEQPLLAQVAGIPMGTRGYSHQVPGLIVVVGDLSAFFDERDRHVIYIDSGLASMGVLLALEAQGVSTCCINWPDIPERERAMAKALDLAEHERVVMLIAYGYGKPDGLVPYSAKTPQVHLVDDTRATDNGHVSEGEVH